jgi:phosphatidylinositol alpha-mannosyltransferase
MKVGIVVPYSWSFWGAVVEHAELQADALRRLGIETKTIMGNDPVGSFTRALHPRLGRGGSPPPDVVPVGRSVIVPANGSLPNVVLSPRTVGRVRETLEREQFDLVHVHEPHTPVIAVATLALAQCPIVATYHSAGSVRWAKIGIPLWGFLHERIDARIAVSNAARDTAGLYAPGDYELIPNGVLIPPEADPSGRAETVLFVGRHERRKGLPVLLKAWPSVHARTGARLRIVGADPLAVRLLIARAGGHLEGVDLVGFLSQDELTRELLAAKVMAAPSIGGESFGMVLTRAFACATPVVASDIPGYRDVMSDEAGLTVPPDDPQALADALVRLLTDERGRRARGVNARLIAQEHYGWDSIARRLLAVYDRVLEVEPTEAVAA